MKKMLLLFTAFVFTLSFVQAPAMAAGTKQAASSLLLPTTGQAMNGELRETKTKVMAGVEVAAITTVAILGGVVGGPVIWAGLGPLIANHAWSAVDAYKGAQNKENAFAEYQMTQAQKTIDMSRQTRYDAAQAQHFDLRERMRLAAESAYAS